MGKPSGSYVIEGIDCCTLLNIENDIMSKSLASFNNWTGAIITVSFWTNESKATVFGDKDNSRPCGGNVFEVLFALGPSSNTEKHGKAFSTRTQKGRDKWDIENRSLKSLSHYKERLVYIMFLVFEHMKKKHFPVSRAVSIFTLSNKSKRFLTF